VQDGSPYGKYVLDGLHVPAPVFSLAIETERSSQQKDLEAALAILVMEDPSVHFEVNAESGQTLIKGVGELHLEIVCEKLKREYKLEVTTGSAYVAYRESIHKDSELETISHTFEREINGKRLFAAVDFVISAAKEITSDPTFSVGKDVRANLSGEEYGAVCDALTNSFVRGPFGYPVVGLDVQVKGLTRDGDTNAGALRACVSRGFNEFLRSDRRCILEPIMFVEAVGPPACIGDVVSDLAVKRRGEILEIANSGSALRSSVTALVPLATTLGYANALRSMTQGDGAFTMEYHGHAIVDEALMLSSY
jgi:elongation factor G